MPKKITSDVLLKDLRTVADRLGRTPKTKEYDQLGSYCVITLRNRFGSWGKACAEAGIETVDYRGAQNKILDDQYLDRIRLLASELGYIPSAKDYNEKFGHPVVVYRRFGTWIDALEAAGLAIPSDPETYRRLNLPFSKEHLITDLQRVAVKLGHTPTCEEYKKHGICHFQTFFYRLGSWAEACIEAGLTPHTTHEGTGNTKFVYHIRQHDRKNVQLAGSYELRFAQWLDADSIHWLCHGEFPTIPYTMPDGTNHKYAPDFYITPWDLFVDTKGWFRKSSKAKIKAVRQCNPYLRLAVFTLPILKALGVFTDTNTNGIDSLPTQLELFQS